MSIIHTLKQVLWAMILLGMIIYVFAILFTQAATIHLTLVELEGESALLDPHELQDLRYYHGSVGASMLALFMSISNGMDWNDNTRLLRKLDEAYVYVMLVFVG